MKANLKHGALLAIATLFVCSCSKTTRYDELKVSKLRQMKSFNATVDEVSVADLRENGRGMIVDIFLTTADGQHYGIGPWTASTNLAEFARSLKKGNTYQFPKALLDFEAAHGRVDEE